MGNLNSQKILVNDFSLEELKYSHFYGHHQIRDNLVVKKYQLSESEKDSFLNLVHIYKKIDLPSLIKIENISLICEKNNTFIYELSFPFYPNSLQSEIQSRKNKNPFTEHQIIQLILNLVETILIFLEKQFPYGYFHPERILLKQQIFVIGIDILMNSMNIKNNVQSSFENKYLSPEELISQKFTNEVDMTKSTIFSIGMIAISAIQFEIIQYHHLEKVIFELRRDYSYQFCNLLKSMLYLDNRNIISLEDCSEKCMKLLERQPNSKGNSHNKFIRGYNSIESFWFFKENISQQSLLKWQEIKMQAIK